MTRDRTFIVAEVADVIEAETLEAPTSHDLAESRRVVGRTPAPLTSRKTARHAWASRRALSPSAGRCSIRPADRLPVEGAASRIWLGLDVPPPLPGVGRGRDL